MLWKKRMGAALAVAMLCAAGRGQTGAPIEIPYTLSSGPQFNDSASPRIAWSEFIDVPFAGTLQLGFQNVVLGGLGDCVIVECLLDGEIQELDATALQLWRQQTAWFNGTRIALKLRLAPGSYGSIDLGLVRAGPPPVAGQDSLCGSDDRVSTTDGRLCRLYGNGGVCTGWLVSEWSRILTAGHCVNCPSSCPACPSNISAPGALVVAQFNVPQSTSSGTIVAPAVQHQYPVASIDLSWPPPGNCPEQGNDWAIATLGPNSLGGTASANQGGWFTLANYAPGIGASVRVTGYGSDSTPATANYTLQTSTGPVLNAASYYRFAVDTEGGSSGGPVTVDGGEADGQAVAINTNSGCTAPPTTGNGGTSLQAGAVRASLDNAQGIVNNFALADGVTQAIYKASTWFSLAFGAAKWNAVALVPDGSWGLSIGQSVSDSSGPAVEALLSNGHLGTPWTAGTAYRKAIEPGARLQHAVAETFTVGTAGSGSLTGTRLARLLEFQVPTAGVHTVAITGTSSLRYTLLGPGADSGWVDLQAPTVLAAGSIGGGYSNALTLAAGWHAVLVHRASSATLNTTESFAVSVCASGTPAITLAEGVPATVTNPCQAFSAPASNGRWNVIGLTSPSTWDTYIGTAVSQAPFGNLVLADGRSGAVPSGQGLFSRRTGADPAVAEFWRAATSTPDTVWPLTIPAGAVLRAYEFNVTAAGNWTVHVTGPTGLAWRLFSPQTSGAWIDFDDHLASGLMGNVPLTVPLQTGWHCLVVHRVPGIPASTTSGSVSVCSGSVLSLASGGAGAAVTSACQMFSRSATSGVWDAVVLNSDPATNWDLHIGTAEATSPTGNCDLAVSDGHAAPISNTRGVVNRVSGTGPGFLQQPGRSTLTPGTSLPLTLDASTIARIVEVPVASADQFDLFVTGTPGASLYWDFFTPRANASWVTRAAAQFPPQLVNGPALTNVLLQPGVHALVIYRLTGTGATSCTVSVQPSLHPVPSLGSMSPTSTFAGTPVPLLTLNGSNFDTSAQVRWNGAAIPTAYVGPNQLTAAPPASLFAAGIAAAVTVVNPGPGGGSSAPLTFTVTNPGPTIASISPSSVIAGGPTFTLTVNGAGFNAQSVVRLGNTSLATTIVGPTQLQASMPASAITYPDLLPIFVLNPAPGGGSSATLTLGVRAPVIATLAPATIPVQTLASPPLTLTITGADFLPTAMVHANGVPLVTSGGSSTLTATLPTSILQAREHGGIAINVANGTFAVSNTRALIVGGGSNAGTIRRHPLNPSAGQAYAAVLEGGIPGSVFSLYADLGTQPPLTAFPDAAANLVLAVTPLAGSPGPLIPIIEGFGLFGPATATTLLSDGSFSLYGFVVPATPFGIDLTIQAVYLDPSAAYGFRLGWARRPDQL